jgi:hypothetical protein
LVNLETILNYKRVKLLVAVLINLARGYPPLNETIVKFVQFLVTNDIRCFGYVIDASLFLINKLKIQNISFEAESNWDYYTAPHNQ